jgi:hypothetical protein
MSFHNITTDSLPGKHGSLKGRVSYYVHSDGLRLYNYCNTCSNRTLTTDCLTPDLCNHYYCVSCVVANINTTDTSRYTCSVCNKQHSKYIGYYHISGKKETW